MSETKAPRSVQKGAQFVFLNVMTVVADVMPTKKTDDTPKTKMVAPHDVLEDPTVLKQQYVVDGREDLGTWTVGTAGRALEVDGELVHVTEDEIKAMKTPALPNGECDFEIFPLEDVLANTLQSGTVYAIKPQKMVEGSKSQKQYAMLVDLVADMERQGTTFVGELTVKSVQRMYRVFARSGNLLLQELVRPDEILPPFEIAHEYDGKLLEMASQLAADQVTEFDPSAYGNTVKARARDLAEQIRSGAERVLPEVPVAKTEDDTDDLLALLSASVASTKKPTKSKAKSAA